MPVRNRIDDLKRICKFLLPQIIKAECELILVEETAFSDPETSESFRSHGARCLLSNSMQPAFHKTLLLNQGLQQSRGEFVIPYDADLLPLFSIEKLCSLVIASPRLIIGGYRIMSGHHFLNVSSPVLSFPKSAPEDCSGAVYKQLMQGERFMVCPVFKRLELLLIGGWDERFVGWGCEDQDILERYCKSTNHICARSRDLLYLHFDHHFQSGWNDAKLVNANRQIYYTASR